MPPRTNDVGRLLLVLQTAYAELVDRCALDTFQTAFQERGNFVAKTIKKRRYWYFQPANANKKQRYVGPETPELLERVASHRASHNDDRERRKLVSTLLRSAFMPRPNQAVGDVLAALSAAGAFRLRAVVVGTIAYQVYAPMLGVRLPHAAIQTDDIDIAQFHAVSVAVNESTPPMLDVLRRADSSFKAIPHRSSKHAVTTYRNTRGLRVEFLAPNRGPERDEAVRLPALGTDAEPLRFLDYLIHEASSAVVLHGAGVYVNVPSPQRYALHKLLVSQRRRAGSPKRDKDLLQAAALIQVLAEKRRHDLRDAWTELLTRGRKWRLLVMRGVAALPAEARAALEGAIVQNPRD